MNQFIQFTQFVILLNDRRARACYNLNWSFNLTFLNLMSKREGERERTHWFLAPEKENDIKSNCEWKILPFFCHNKLWLKEVYQLPECQYLMANVQRMRCQHLIYKLLKLLFKPIDAYQFIYSNALNASIVATTIECLREREKSNKILINIFFDESPIAC